MQWDNWTPAIFFSVKNKIISYIINKIVRKM